MKTLSSQHQDETLGICHRVVHFSAIVSSLPLSIWSSLLGPFSIAPAPKTDPPFPSDLGRSTTHILSQATVFPPLLDHAASCFLAPHLFCRHLILMLLWQVVGFTSHDFGGQGIYEDLSWKPKSKKGRFMCWLFFGFILLEVNGDESDGLSNQLTNQSRHQPTVLQPLPPFASLLWPLWWSHSFVMQNYRWRSKICQEKRIQEVLGEDLLDVYIGCGPLPWFQWEMKV